jgi:hypothetical protein
MQAVTDKVTRQSLDPEDGIIENVEFRWNPERGTIDITTLGGGHLLVKDNLVVLGPTCPVSLRFNGNARVTA